MRPACTMISAVMTTALAHKAAGESRLTRVFSLWLMACSLARGLNRRVGVKVAVPDHVHAPAALVPEQGQDFLVVGVDDIHGVGTAPRDPAGDHRVVAPRAASARAGVGPGGRA